MFIYSNYKVCNGDAMQLSANTNNHVYPNGGKILIDNKKETVNIGLITDSHIGYAKQKVDFMDLVDVLRRDYGCELIILLGDILDFWRRGIDYVISKNKHLIKFLINSPDIYYIRGNHDYVVDRIISKPIYDKIQLNLLNNVGMDTIYLKHGYDIDVNMSSNCLSLNQYLDIAEKLCYTNNIVGEVLSDIWNIHKYIDMLLLWENRKKEYIKACELVSAVKKDNECIIFGHYHKEYLDYKSHVFTLYDSNKCAYVLSISPDDYKILKYPII